ncbi:MAG: hypothetical protein JXL84_14560, partial [Deltaproteobacteria bacterium]|nr:hypothetical protein [Deltaproteobacteria bacterium]
TATVLVNGAAISQVLIKQREEGEEGEEGEPEEEKKYFLDIVTQNQRTTIAANGKDQLWIYGQVTCTDPEVDTAGLTRSLGFTPGGPNAEWLRLGDMQMSGESKAVCVTASPPAPEASLQDGGAFVRVGTMIEGKVVSGDVQLELVQELIMEFV